MPSIMPASLFSPRASRLSVDWLPTDTEETAFDAKSFCKALDSYLELQISQDRGRLPEKRKLIAELKPASENLSNLKGKLAFQALLTQGEYQLKSYIFGVDTAGSDLLNSWLQRLNQDPELQQAAVEKEKEESSRTAFSPIPHT